MFFAQSSCRPLLQEDCQVTIPMRTRIFVNLFFMEAVDVYQNHGAILAHLAPGFIVATSFPTAGLFTIARLANG